MALAAAPAAFALLLAAPGLHGQEAAGTATIDGRVEGTGGGALQVEVVVSGPRLPELRRVRADADGRFTVRRLPAGDYRLRFEALGYAHRTEGIEGLEAGETRTVEVSLEPAPIALREMEVVSASRTLESASRVPAAVSVLDARDLRQQVSVSTDLGAIVGQVVPGLAPSTDTQSNFGQTLRGRPLMVLIDGVPITTPLRNGERSLRSIDPAAIERIEVVRGATAVYGFGGTAGLVNIITRQPTAGDFRAETTLRTSASSADLGETFDGRLSQTVSGGGEGFRFSAGATLESTGDRYDGAGDLIPPHRQGGLGNATATSFFGRATVELSPTQQLSVSGDYYELMQDPELRRVAGDPSTGQKALAQPGDPLSEDVGNERVALNLRYRNTDVGGSSLDLQTYYDDHLARFTYSSFFDAQSRIESSKQGVRLNVTTPLAGIVEGAGLRWGADYLHDETAQPLSDGRFFVPPMDQHSVGPFAQIEVPVGERLTVEGGVRHEQIWLDVDDFTTIEEVGGASVAGGDLRYDATVFNLGVIAGLTDELDAFASFSEGFSVSEVGRELRTTSAPSVEALSPAPKKTDGFELGFRGRWSRLHVAVSGYLNDSDLGSSYGPDFRIVRTPEEIRGLEAEVDVTPTDRWKVGGALTLIEGEQDADDDGEVDDPLNTLRVPPTKVTAYLENETLPGWRNRLQVLRSGSRNEFPGSTTFGEGAVESYTVVDFTSGLDVWRGRLNVSVKNLLDEFYLPITAQAANFGPDFVAAEGRRISAEYRIAW